MSNLTFFDLPATFLPTAKLLDEDQETLRKLEGLAQQLESEVRRVALDCTRLDGDKCRMKLCVDFSVIISSLNAADPKKPDAFWANVAMYADAVDLVLLPGTLFELMVWANRQQTKLPGFEGQMASAFKRAFETSSFSKPNSIEKSYRTFFDQASNVIALNEDNSLLALLRQQRFELIPKNLLAAPDEHLLYQYMSLLADGSRTDLVINNRVDAYNLALVNKLNNQGRESGQRYAMLSNATSMKRLSQVSADEGSLREGQSIATVWSPRYASIHQLLSRAGFGAGGAASISWKLVQRLVTYRAHLSRLLALPAKRQRSGISEIKFDTADDLFIHFISSIELLQSLLAYASINRQKTAEQAQVLAKVSSPAQTKNLIKSELKKFLDVAGYGEPVNRLLPPERVPLQLQQNDVFAADLGLNRFSLKVSDSNQLAASLYSGPRFSGIWFQTPATLEQFVAVLNYVRHSIFTRATMGDVPSLKKDQAGVTVLTEKGGQEFEASQFGWPLKTLEVCKLGKCQPLEIEFMRVNTHWADFTYEIERASGKRFCAMASHLPVYEEFEFFVKELNEVGVRGADYRTHLRNAFFERENLWDSTESSKLLA